MQERKKAKGYDKTGERSSLAALFARASDPVRQFHRNPFPLG
jgi:hypothetical protein